MPEPQSRCVGHCCKCFALGLTPDELEMQKVLGDPESDMIFGMIMPLGPMTNSEAWKISGGVKEEFLSSEEKYNPDHIAERYTCKHLLPNGDCDNYENRPQMCRQYPDYGRGGLCEYKECGACQLKKES